MRPDYWVAKMPHFLYRLAGKDLAGYLRTSIRTDLDFVSPFESCTAILTTHHLPSFSPTTNSWTALQKLSDDLDTVTNSFDREATVKFTYVATSRALIRIFFITNGGLGFGFEGVA
jgi:hypothetical protein